MRRLLYILFICMSATVYAQQWHTTIEVLTPAERDVPKDLGDLLIVNNSVQQPPTFGHSNLINGSQVSSDSIDLSGAARSMLFSVAMALEESEFIGSVSLIDYSINESGSFFSRHSLTAAQAKQLQTDYQATSVLALNSIVQYDRRECFLTTDGYYYAYLQAYLSSNWTLYDKNGNAYNLTYQDTLYWESEDDIWTQALAGLPDRRTALIDMTTDCGYLFAQSLQPQWQTVDRYFYESSNEILRNGMEQVRRRQWDKAAEQLIEAYNKATDKKEMLTAAYAAADMAVVQEITGNLQDSKKWASKAADCFGQVRTKHGLQQQINLLYYAQQIENRMADEKKLR